MDLCCFAPEDEMGSVQTLVCVKQVKERMPEEEWDESMPLPGDIIEGIAEQESEKVFMSVKGKSELSAQLGRLLREVDLIWVKVRRGNTVLKLRACVVPERCAKLQRRFTIRAASDDRHVAILGDLTWEQCSELQEKSRRVVNVMEDGGFQKKGMKYDWKKKVGTYLPDQRSSVICSLLFMPFSNEHAMEATTARSMAWFSAARSSGAPLIFVNIQTEQIVASRNGSSGGTTQTFLRDMSWTRNQNPNTTFQILQAIRLWFLPGVSEIPVTLTPELGEKRFGIDMKPTDEGFICIYAAAKGSPADRAGIGHLCEQANAAGSLVIISRLEGKSLMPSTVSSTGLIHCCDHINVKETLRSALDRLDVVHLCIMAWPAQKGYHCNSTLAVGAAALRPPAVISTTGNGLNSGPPGF